MRLGLALGIARRANAGGASGPAVTALVATATGGTTAQLDITASAGTLYWYISTSATPPSVANIKDGTGATSFGNYTHPGTFTGPSGLTASTTYYPYALVNDGVSDSEIYAGASFATEAADVTAPSLTSPGATVLDTTSADLNVTTDEGRGTLWAIASTVNSPPSAAQIKLGQDGSGTTTNVAFAAGGGAGVNVSATGVQTITATGLTEVAHYGFLYQEDPTGNGSSVVATGAFTPADVTGPVLSSAEGTVSGSYGGTGAVNTDTGEGLLSSVATKSSTTPTATQIIAGQDHTGAAVPTGAKDLANTVSASGPQAVAFSDLDGASAYWAHFAQTDVATNQSNAITASASFTTAAAAVPGTMSAPSLAVDSSTQITATLAADPARNGADITSYDLRHSTDEATWTTVTGITSPHAITGLSAATLYYVQTRAVNSVGAGAWSASASDTTSSGSFAPSSLFASAEQGLAFEIATSTCFTDTVGGTAAAVTDAVAAISDISGNANHLSPLGGPILRQEGTGEYYLEMDGTNDGIPFPADITGSEARTVILGIKADEAAGATASLAIFTLGGNLSNTGEAWALYHESSLALRTGGNKIFNAALGTSAAVVLTNYWATSLGTGVVDDAVLRIDGTALGQTSATGATINTTPATFAPRIAAWNSGGTEGDNLQCRIYAGIIINRLLTAGELADAEAWVAARIP